MSALIKLQTRLDQLRGVANQSVSWRQRREQTDSNPPHDKELSASKPSTRRSTSTATSKIAGWTVCIVFVFGGLLWSSVTRLDGAAIAHGTVGVESNRKSVAHLEGGIVKRILIDEGQAVLEGQPLIEIDNTRAFATLELLNNRQNVLVAKKARLDAERRDLPTIEFPSALLDLGSDPLMIDLMDGEMHVLETRRQNLDRQDSIIRERISKQSAIIRGHRAKRIAIEKRLALLQDEFGMMSKLLKKGLVAKNRVLSVERSIVDSEGEFQDLAANIAEAGDEIAKLEMERALSMDRHQRDVAAEIQETNERMAEVAEQIRAAKDVLARTVIKAPEDGVVVALRHHTLGGVVQAGEPILDIVPNHDQHIIELRINPNDVDVIFPGQRARVRLAAYNARTSPMIEGTVINVSPDKTSDPVTGSTFFTGRVMPDIGTLESIPSLMSGMQAEVFIMTAERTVLDYLLDPLFRSIDRAGRES